MSFFKPFRLISPYQIQGKDVLGIDLTRRQKISQDIKNLESLTTAYTIKDGDTPENIADRLYDNVNDYWIICAVNNIIDISKDWPMTQYVLEQYLLRKYDDIYAIHHYISASTNAIVDSDWPSYDRIPVTIFEYETNLNDAKRNIKLPIPEQIGLLKQLHRGS